MNWLWTLWNALVKMGDVPLPWRQWHHMWRRATHVGLRFWVEGRTQLHGFCFEFTDGCATCQRSTQLQYTFQDGCGVRAHEGHINSGGLLAWLTAGSTWGICRLVGWAVCFVVLGRSEVSLSQRAFWRGLAVTLKETGLPQMGPVAVCSPKCQRWKKKALRFQNFMKDSGSCYRLANYPLAPQRNQNLSGLLFADITENSRTYTQKAWEGKVFWINSDKLQSAKKGISCFKVCFYAKAALGAIGEEVWGRVHAGHKACSAKPGLWDATCGQV